MNIVVTKQTIGNQGAVNAVNSRELYNELGLAKGQYSRWIQTNLIEIFRYNDDYMGVRQDVEGNEVISYIVTMDTAKHLCMMAKTPNAMQIRQYFIDVEKKTTQPKYQIPQTLSEALLLAGNLAKEVETKSQQLIEQEPKISVYNAIISSTNLKSMQEVANLLKMGRNTFFDRLRADGYIIPDKRMPYANYLKEPTAFFEIKERSFQRGDSMESDFTPYITAKGLEHFTRKYKVREPLQEAVGV